MAQDLLILSPEKTVLSFRLASLGSRIAAKLLDLILILVAVIAITIICALIFGSTAPALFALIVPIASALGPFLYFILFEGLGNGQTIGKRALGIQVRAADGTPINFGAALARNLLLPADLMPGTGFAGLLVMFCTPRSQRLGDIVGNTIVVHSRRVEPVFSVAPHIVGLHPLETQVGDLKNMTLEEYNALRRFCDRYPELPSEVQAKLMREVFVPIARRNDVPELANVHPIYIAEAVVMRYGRTHGLL